LRRWRLGGQHDQISHGLRIVPLLLQRLGPGDFAIPLGRSDLHEGRRDETIMLEVMRADSALSLVLPAFFAGWDVALASVRP
jgi:hypothetical protein